MSEKMSGFPEQCLVPNCIQNQQKFGLCLLPVITQGSPAPGQARMEGKPGLSLVWNRASSKVRCGCWWLYPVWSSNPLRMETAQSGHSGVHSSPAWRLFWFCSEIQKLMFHIPTKSISYTTLLTELCCYLSSAEEKSSSSESNCQIWSKLGWRTVGAEIRAQLALIWVYLTSSYG